MSVVGESLVGGPNELADKMEAWGYRAKAGGLLADAVCLYQSRYKAELDDRCLQLYGEPSKADGVIGPATAAVINSRFCMVPDFANREEARWPDSCSKDITVSWNFDNMPGASKAETDAAWESLSTYTELFNLRIVLAKGRYPQTRIHASLKRLPGSTLAWSFLPNNNCSSRLEQAYDSTVSWSKESLRVGTIRHEVGHALGMNHTPSDRNSVMYPSMNGQFELNETDIRNMLGLGYKRRTGPPPPDPDTPAEPKVSVVVRVGDERYEHAWPRGNNDNPFWPV